MHKQLDRFGERSVLFSMKVHDAALGEGGKHLMSIYTMHSLTVALLELDSNESHQLLLVHWERHNMLGADSFAGQNVCHTQHVKVLCRAL